VILRPPKLAPGSTIGVVGPASPMLESRLRNGIAYLEKRGYRVKLGESVRRVYGYLAGNDRQRADDINAMFADPEVQAIFCTRGGYGTPRLLHLIDYDVIVAAPKILVGYSDITALQMAILAKASLITFSGPMVAVEMGVGIDAFTESHFWPLLTDRDAPRQLWLEDEEERELGGQALKGRLIGGNLAMLASMVGTPYLPSFEGCILVIEDVGEEPYKTDRNLIQLRQAGLLGRLSALVVGNFSDCEASSENSLTLPQLIADVTGDLGVPVFFSLPYGHVSRKYTLPIGASARVDAARRCIEILAPVVA